MEDVAPDRRPAQARLGSGILADSSLELDNGKVIAQGLITTFWAWGFPCSRSCVVFSTVFDLSPDTATLLVSFAKSAGDPIRTMTTLDLKSATPKGATTAVIPIRVEFTQAGDFEFRCSLKDVPGSVALPFLVRQREWPEFTDAERQFATDNPGLTHRLRANVQCKKCSHAFIFEESVLDEPAPGGVIRFPPGGTLECGDCGHVLRLLDIQGQLRASLKAVLNVAMGGKQ
jgi:hypothetical protein